MQSFDVTVNPGDVDVTFNVSAYAPGKQRVSFSYSDDIANAHFVDISQEFRDVLGLIG